MNQKKILFITQGDITGANTAIITTAEALSHRGHQVQILIKERSRYHPLTMRLSGKRSNTLSLPAQPLAHAKYEKHVFIDGDEASSYADIDITLKHLRFSPNFIFVGLSTDFLSAQDIDQLANVLDAVVYYVLLDMQHLTGGCHFAWDCLGYIQGCDTVLCPAVDGEAHQSMVHRNYQIKRDLISKGNSRILAGTAHSQALAARSELYRHQPWIPAIGGVVNTNLYHPNLRSVARQVFALDPDTFYILSGCENALDSRKGYQHFVTALCLLYESLTEAQRCRVGILTVTRIPHKDSDLIPFQTTSIPYITDDRLLALLYQSADVWVNSSVEDMGPSTLLEALSCGTPVVSFDTGVAPYVINNGVNGYIVPNQDHQALADAIAIVFDLPESIRHDMTQTCHQSIVDDFSLSAAVKKVEILMSYHDSHQIPASAEPTLSVALCSYNGEKYIAEQLESIIHQTLPVEEIIICDDGSSDKTIEIIHDFQERYPQKIRLYQNSHNIGVTKNFERAINHCNGDIILLSDQDDIWHVNKTEIIVQAFRDNPEKCAVFHDLNILLADGSFADVSMWESLAFDEKTRATMSMKELLVVFGNFVTGMAMAIKRPRHGITLDDSGGLHFLHDYLLALHYAFSDHLLPINECLADYRQHADQQLGYSRERMGTDYASIWTHPKMKWQHLTARLAHFTHFTSEAAEYHSSLAYLRQLHADAAVKTTPAPTVAADSHADPSRYRHYLPYALKQRGKRVIWRLVNAIRRRVGS